MNSFRAIWPIHDETTEYTQLLRQATADLPRLLTQAHAVKPRNGRFSIAQSCHVPGSGNITQSVLVYEAIAEERPERAPLLAAAPTRISRRKTGAGHIRVSAVDRAAEWEQMRTGGVSMAGAASRMGITEEGLKKALRRAKKECA